MRDALSGKVKQIKPSGIRKFFDIVSEMDDAISLGVGEPDFDTPWHIREEGIYSLEKGRTFYTSNAGLSELKIEISKYLDRRFDLKYDPSDEIMITVGGSEAIDGALRAMLDAGDEVILPQPSYVSYEPCIVLADGVPVIVELKEENDFKLTREQLEKAVTDKTKILIMPFPNNPTGAIMTKEELQPIVDFVIEHDLFVISDEIYSELTYSGNHVSIGAFPGMKERTIVINGFSKSYAMTGWRLGYAIAPENIMARIRQYHDFNAVGCPSPLMEAAVVGLNMPLSYYDEFGAHYAHMKNIFTEGMRDIGIPFTDPEGTYFVLADISPYLKKGQSDVDFCEQLARKAGVGAVPGSSFFNEPINNIVRLHFAKKDETLYAALDRLNHIKDMM